MAPKKKGNKTAGDDWEPEAENASPALQDDTIKETPTEADVEDEFPAGGLMAMLRKKQKKGKKGKGTEDFVEGEDPTATGDQDIADKAPVEASLDDEFALPEKKGQGKTATVMKEEDIEDDERGADGKVLTKAQKEKLKKEREKQRKKENVPSRVPEVVWVHLLTGHRLRRKRRQVQ